MAQSAEYKKNEKQLFISIYIFFVLIKHMYYVAILSNIIFNIIQYILWIFKNMNVDINTFTIITVFVSVILGW